MEDVQRSDRQKMPPKTEEEDAEHLDSLPMEGRPREVSESGRRAPRSPDDDVFIEDKIGRTSTLESLLWRVSNGRRPRVTSTLEGPQWGAFNGRCPREPKGLRGEVQRGGELFPRRIWLALFRSQ